VTILIFVVMAVAAYLLGGINGSIIASLSLYRKDIRKYGSKNPGLTNFYRVFGKSGIPIVILIDVLKNAVPVFIGGYLIDQIGGNALLGRAFIGLCVMIGNAYPIYYGFRGGKCVMTMGIVLFFIDWRVALATWSVFLILLLLTRRVSLSAIIGVFIYPLLIGLFGLGGVQVLCIAIASAVFLVTRHRDNIKRLLNGTESKISAFRPRDS